MSNKISILKCDECGELSRNDNAALSESCDCGRFKQRMDWATVDDVLNRVEKGNEALATMSELYADKCLEVEKLQAKLSPDDPKVTA